MQEYIRTLETMTKNIKECLACASTWYDDGFTAECPQCRVRRLEEENRNHKQTLAGIAAMNPTEEGDRAIQWAKDGLSGYTMPVDATVKYLQDRVRELENALERVRAERDTAQEACDAELTEQHDRFEDRERGLKDTVDALDARVRELEATLTHEQADNDRLEQELAKEREARADLVRRVEEVANRIVWHGRSQEKWIIAKWLRAIVKGG